MVMKARLIVVSVAAIAATTLFVSLMASADVPGPLFASPQGQNEIPDADPDGRGGFTAIIDGDQFCFGLTVTNLDQPTGAHIHKANAGANGDIVIPLTAPATGDPGTSSGCVSADPALLQDILNRPGQYYVNVHTVVFPGGGIRDQLVRQPR
jgi:hypothetical protein